MVYIFFFAALIASFFALFGIWMLIWSLVIGVNPGDTLSLKFEDS